jgi:photosystem II stability/assembly factor-like uncharacterized protein
MAHTGRLHLAHTGDHGWPTQGGCAWPIMARSITLAGARVNAIVIDPLDPLVLYAGTGWRRWSGSPETIGIFKSTDGGETWQEKLSEGLDAVAALLIDADSSSYIYAGVYTEGGGPGFRKSADGGETWMSRRVGRLWPWDDIVALAMTPAGSSLSVIYAVNESDGDVFKSTDRGDSWAPTDIPFTSETSPLAVDPNNPNVIYAGSMYYQGNLFKSTDGGDT